MCWWWTSQAQCPGWVMRPKLTLSQSTSWGDWSLLTAPLSTGSALLQIKDKLQNDEAQTLNLAAFSLPISRDIFYIGREGPGWYWLIRHKYFVIMISLYNFIFILPSIPIHKIQSDSKDPNLWCAGADCSPHQWECHDILMMEYFCCQQGLDIGQIYTISCQAFYSSIFIIEAGNIAMKTSNSNSRWRWCDDSQDYWESDLSCIHCPPAVGGKSLYLSTDYFFSSQSPYFQGLKITKPRFMIMTRPPSSPLLGCVAMV